MFISYQLILSLICYNNHMKILIIEDEVKIGNSIKKGLEQEFFVVDVANDGSTGLDLALSEKYDLIILDRLLPGVDGLKICKKLRVEKNTTPILLLTAKGQISDRVEGLNSGADDYLVKPFAFEELLARVKALLRRPKNSSSNILVVSDLVLDTTSFEIKRDNKNINLSKKEFIFLKYLMRHKGKIVTKDEIMSNVWDYDSDILSNTIEVYIKHLREKIDKPFKDKKPLIKTVRGFGYKIGE